MTFVLDAFHDEVTTDDATAVGGSLTPSGQRRIGSFLVQDAIALTPSTVAIAELRYDSYRLESDDGDVSGSELSPGLTLRQQVGNALTLHATVAQAYRPPTLSESLVNGMHPEPADFFVRPNPKLKPERSLTTEAGATLALADLILPGDRLDAVLAAYRNDVEDFIGLVERGTLFDRYLQYDNIELGPHRGHRARDRLRRRARVRQPLRPDHRRGKPRDRRPGLGHRAEPAGADRRLAQPRPDPRSRRPADAAGSREDGVLSSEAWHTLDLFLTRSLGAHASFGLALNNVTDATYTQYLNTQPSPGFNALASLSITF